MAPESAVIISHYTAHPTNFLLSLLSQIKSVSAGAAFDVIVVVNRAAPEDLPLPPLPIPCTTLYRENTGYNIGAWQHGWAHARHYRYYLFLQDECTIVRPGWLAAFIAKAQSGYGLVCESLVVRPSIKTLSKSSPDFMEQIAILQQRLGLESVRDWTHAQTTIVFATAGLLDQVGGFIVPDNHKIRAIASEVAFSVVARRFGFRITQVSFLPFQYIGHPQWSRLRLSMENPVGRIRRLVNLALWRSRGALGAM